jgi:hypothetical protein
MADAAIGALRQHAVDNFDQIFNLNKLFFSIAYRQLAAPNARRSREGATGADNPFSLRETVARASPSDEGLPRALPV